MTGLIVLHNGVVKLKNRKVDSVTTQFFDAYQWHLDDRPLARDDEINPDILGYIFEKYINQKQMGAYYTKEDITGYIARNTILPFLLDAAAKKCPAAFQPGGPVWRLLRDDPDKYIYPAVRQGVDLPLPESIAAGSEDIAQRGGWNRPAAAEFALPTETWREHMARRQRCHELRRRLRAGEVHAVNDLVTCNLDVSQLAEDVLDTCDDPDLLRAFWHALEKVSVLDPTCGSGAFLFAALNVLEPLYVACLERMQFFLDELERSGVAHRPEKFADFRKVLGQIDKHPSRDYFVLKSIIIHNLYGVDIMKEAVEICKLRLFLKLVAQVRRVDQLEPLPDIDFNIRAGNTLVGFARLEDVEKTLEGTLGYGQSDVDRICEDAEIADRAFRRFQEMQTEHGMDAKAFADAKAEVRLRLNELRTQLDRFLAGDYGVEPYDREFDLWEESHKPFHWFTEFYGIMESGGFDVIIGNPPYIELNAIDDYRLIGYNCTGAGNLYAVVLERCTALRSTEGYLGFIVPVSSVSTERYEPLQRLITQYDLFYSSFDDRPSRLFDGLEHIRLTIHLLGIPSRKPSLASTRYNKWNAVERPFLFDGLVYTTAWATLVEGSLPKLSCPTESSILQKFAAQRARLSDYYSRSGRHSIYYSRKVPVHDLASASTSSATLLFR
jgi:hypothetical protein